MMQDYYLYILPASIALFWIVRIFLSKDTNKAQLFIAGGMLMALLSLFFGGEFALFIFPLFITVLQFLIGYYTFRMKDTSSIAAELSEVTDDIREDSTVQEVTDDDLIRKVISDELYLDPTISLVSLAERLGTNRTYLSASIHACRKQNFSDFINSLRISRFIEIASSEGSLTNIKDAATRSGYRTRFRL